MVIPSQQGTTTKSKVFSFNKNASCMLIMIFSVLFMTITTHFLRCAPYLQGALNVGYELREFDNLELLGGWTVCNVI
jgi:hypothetical protein